ncbi:MAG: hypothetical protein KBD78_09600 [Oligoflexales bacterium]|nr:hypothetical protein [Oligoflexales bacterium]
MLEQSECFTGGRKPRQKQAYLKLLGVLCHTCLDWTLDIKTKMESLIPSQICSDKYEFIKPIYPDHGIRHPYEENSPTTPPACELNREYRYLQGGVKPCFCQSSRQVDLPNAFEGRDLYSNFLCMETSNICKPHQPYTSNLEMKKSCICHTAEADRVKIPIADSNSEYKYYCRKSDTPPSQNVVPPVTGGAPTPPPQQQPPPITGLPSDCTYVQNLGTPESSGDTRCVLNNHNKCADEKFLCRYELEHLHWYQCSTSCVGKKEI